MTALIISESTSLAINDASPDANLVCDTAFVSANQTTPSVATSTVYYDDGRTRSTTDANGKITTYEYSGDGTLRTVRPPDYTDPDGNVLATLIIDTSDLNGNVVTSQTKSFKVIGGVQNSTAESQRPRMRSVYDQMNRPKETWVHTDENDAVGVKLSAITYDWLGRKTLETKWDNSGTTGTPATPDSTQTKFDYDGLSRLTRVTAGYGPADHTATQYSYDEVGNLVTQYDGNQFDSNDAMISGAKSTTFQYDALGRRTRRTLPMGATFEQWEYDFDESAGASSTGLKRPNTIRHKDFSGQYLTTVNDVTGRLAQKKQSGTLLSDYAYTAAGQRSQMRDNLNASARTTKYVYDDLQRLRIKNMPEGTLTYDYDNGGNLKLISARRTYNNIPPSPPFDFATISATGSDTRSTGAYMAYKLDTRGRVMRVNEDTGGANADASYTFDPVGNLTKTKYRNTVQSSYTYNARNQLTLLTAGPNGNSATASFKYDDSTWSPDRRLGSTGQRRKLDETINGASRNYEYDYDALHRLKKENVLSGANAGTVTYDGASGYGDVGYDKVGNRGKRDSTMSGVVQRVYAPYDANDRLGNYATTPASGQVSARFDNNGNTVQFNLDADAVWDQASSDTYELENRLTSAVRAAGTLAFVYDGDGNRVKKTVVATTTTTTYFLADDRNPTGYAQVLEESATAGGTPNIAYTIGLSLISQTSSGITKDYGFDGLGSVRYLTDGTTGNVLDTYTYDAFGIQTASTGTTANNFRYAGEQLDQQLGMYYLRAPRYYHPELGRFWTRDSYEGFREIPTSRHAYQYAELDPISRIDPSGNASTTAARIGTAVHRYIDQDFTESVPGGVSGPSIIKILEGIPAVKLPASVQGVVTALFPDLTDPVNQEVYEIKPDNATSLLLGEAQLQAYVDLFNYLDPRKGWHRGTSYTPPLTVPVDALTYAVAVKATPGMILYKVFDGRRLIKRKLVQTAIAENADLNDSIGIASLNAVLGGF